MRRVDNDVQVDGTDNDWRDAIASFDLAAFRVLKGDLALGGAPISEADDELIDICQSSAMERHLAINWLHGYCAKYSETDTST